MDALRLVLILANLVALAFAIYLVNREIDFYGSLKGDLWGWAVVSPSSLISCTTYLINSFSRSREFPASLIYGLTP